MAVTPVEIQQAVAESILNSVAIRGLLSSRKMRDEKKPYIGSADARVFNQL